MRTVFFRLGRALGGVVRNDLGDESKPHESLPQMMPLIESKVVDGILRLLTACAAQALFRQNFSGQDVEGEEVLRTRAPGPGTWVHIPTRRPFLTLCMVAVVTGEQPVRPRIDEVRVSALGTEVVHFSSAYVLAIGTEVVKCMGEVARELAPPGIAWLVANSRLVVPDPSGSVPRADTLQPIRLGATIYPMHALRLRIDVPCFRSRKSPALPGGALASRALQLVGELLHLSGHGAAEKLAPHRAAKRFQLIGF